MKLHLTCLVCDRVRLVDTAVPVCEQCRSDLDQPTRNRLFSGREEMREAVKEIRVQHQAKALGLKVRL
jgi:uncharacterized protein YlaI